MNGKIVFEQAAAAPIVTISYCGIGLPCAYWLSFVKNKGVTGLCMGYFLGVLVHTIAYITIWLRLDWREQAVQVRETRLGASIHE